MPQHHLTSTLQGKRPGSHDVPTDRILIRAHVEERRRDRCAAQIARRTNPAYGTLNVEDCHESNLLAPHRTGGRPRKPVL